MRRRKQFERLGCTVDLVERVFERDPVDIWSAEFYAGAGTRLRPFLETKRELIDPAVADILEQALRQELRDYYGKVFERYALRDTLRPFFERYDILLSPVLPVTSLDVGKNVPDHLADRNLVSWVYYTYPFNLTGQPAATVCAGIAADGMPVGLQIVGRALGEVDVVRAAAAYERSQPAGYNVRPFVAVLIRCVSLSHGFSTDRCPPREKAFGPDGAGHSLSRHFRRAAGCVRYRPMGTIRLDCDL